MDSLRVNLDKLNPNCIDVNELKAISKLNPNTLVIDALTGVLLRQKY